ncbi:hypothetical protein P9990_25185 (plasmid) [Prescottella equi]|uniref:hypothetical protein n=1 Tax=Rhodococcus hoagii TaxID=43767 RepID=UPI002575F2D2|nr:hypothetical protein [Prescottella equi]WJJ14490.1 hypothetical protein P9990_25185 [Prescottella equi]
MSDTSAVMLGWDIAVIRPREPLVGPDDPRLDPEPSSDEFDSLRSSRILGGDTMVSWSANLGGLDWLDEPAPCRQLRGGGYPSVYAVPAGVVRTGVDLSVVNARYPETVPSLDLSAVIAVPSDEWLPRWRSSAMARQSESLPDSRIEWIVFDLPAPRRESGGFVGTRSSTA